MKKIFIILIILGGNISVTFSQADWEIELEKMQADIDQKVEQVCRDIDVDMERSTADLAYNYVSVDNSVSEEYTICEEEESKGVQDDDLFDKLSDIKGVEVVYISKSLLGMMPQMNLSGVDIGSVAAKLDELQIFSAEGNNNAVKTLKSEANKLVKKGKYETIMFVKDDDSKTVFYLKKIDKNKSEMLMVTEEKKEVKVIRFIGGFSMKELQNIANMNK